MATQRRLFELLEEQQEPFLLDIHLLENGYSIKRLQRLGSSHGFKTRRGVGFLRSILTKIVHGKSLRKALNWDIKSIESGRLSVFDCFSDMGIKTHDGETDRLLCSGIRGRELDGDRQWRCMEMEDSKQLSPVSVFELHSDQSSPFHNHIGFKEENPSTSSLDSPREAPEISGLPHHRKLKREVSHGEKLLLDSVREAEERIWDSHGCLTPEVTEKAIHEKILSWERLKGDVTSLTQLMGSDLSESRREWSQFRLEVREIGSEIEASIFEEIREEIVLETIGFDCTYKIC